MKRLTLPFLAALALALTACGGEGGDDYAAQLRGQVAQPAAQSAPATSTTAPTTTPAPTAGNPTIPAPLPTPEPTIAPVSLAVIPTPEPLPTTTPYVVPTYTPAPPVPAMGAPGECWCASATGVVACDVRVQPAFAKPGEVVLTCGMEAQP